jgi:hypothetical protein
LARCIPFKASFLDLQMAAILLGSYLVSSSILYICGARHRDMHQSAWRQRRHRCDLQECAKIQKLLWEGLPVAMASVLLLPPEQQCHKRSEK